MSGVNKALILGRLGQAPEMRFTQSGTAVCNFSVATSEKWKDKDGSQKEKTEWHNVVAFGKLGEICGEYLSKGSQVFIEGKIQTDKYEKDGVTRYSTKINASSVQFIGGKKEDTEGAKNDYGPVDTEDVPF